MERDVIEDGGNPTEKGKTRKGKIARRVASALVLVVAVLAVGFAWYVSDYYHADDVALAAAADADGAADGVIVREVAGGKLAFIPEKPTAGLMFYPGGKVQPQAYAPLLTECARHGVLCVLAEPVFNIAFFDVNAADGVREQFPDVRTWFVGGHSLGGAVSSMYLSGHMDEYEGIAFLGAYPAADLSGFGGRALCLYGSEDGVMSRAKYDEARVELPANTEEFEMPGANHAQFGNYGQQAGDNEASITREEQQEQTAVQIAQLANMATSEK